jgi:hypothetical protein
MPAKYVALRSIPISIQVDNVTVRGEVVLLLPNEIVVEITSPVSGRWLPAHIPYFAMGNPAKWYATVDGWQTTGLSEYGTQRASDLLKELYDRNKNDAAFAPPVPHATAYLSQTATPTETVPEVSATVE